MSNNSKVHSLVIDFLGALCVPYTVSYTLERAGNMPFKTLFGLSKLLQEYGIESEGYLLRDKEEIVKLTPPFIAETEEGFTIVTGLENDKVSYLTQGVQEVVPLSDFMQVWDGNVMLAFPAPDAKEPSYERHSRIEMLMKAKKWVLFTSVSILMLYLVAVNGIWRHMSTVFMLLIDIAGIYITYLLLQKSLSIRNPAADRFCSVLEAGGCDSILKTKASKFFGLFGWSEVGFAYFSVSLITLLLLPGMLPWLALCNLCCLPFSFWSIWYQKFRARKWCTLCVCVQFLLWLLFFCYLFGGWFKNAWPISLDFIALGLAYLVVMLGLNALMPLVEKGEELGSEEKDN